MSISPIGGVGPAPNHPVTNTVGKPESTEVPGAPEHDGDGDDGAAKAPKIPTPGQVNIKA